MDEALAQLPFLNTIILETPKLSTSDELAKQLVLVQHLVQRRTCQDGKDLAEAVKNEGVPARERPIVSPLWYDSDYSDDRGEW